MNIISTDTEAQSKNFNGVYHRIKSNIPNGALTVDDMQTFSGLETTIIRVDTFDTSVDGFCYTIEDCPYYWEATAFEKNMG